jgi:hypothetical protein
MGRASGQYGVDFATEPPDSTPDAQQGCLLLFIICYYCCTRSISAFFFVLSFRFLIYVVFPFTLKWGCAPLTLFSHLYKMFNKYLPFFNFLKFALFIIFFMLLINAYRVLIGKPARKRPLVRPRLRWEDNIKMGFREIGWGGIDLIYLA